MSRYDLLSLQGKAKRDPEGYRDDVLMQLQHYNALLTKGARKARGANRHADGLRAGRLGGRAASKRHAFFRTRTIFFLTA